MALPRRWFRFTFSSNGLKIKISGEGIERYSSLLVVPEQGGPQSMTKFDIAIFVGACIVFVAALFAGIRYNKHLELKNKDKNHE